MEQKKNIKVSLSTLLLIFTILIIIVMIIYIIKLNNKKTEKTKKSTELQTQVDNLSNTVTELQRKINKISETINSNINQENDSTKLEISEKDYSKYFGTWYNNNDEFIIKNIGNDLITFTWFIYRTASIDDVTLPFKDNKAVFYYHGYDDKNYNSKNEDDEFYCRKATIELNEFSISIKVENSTLEESNQNISLDKTNLFGGGVYIQPGQYNFSSKR